MAVTASSPGRKRRADGFSTLAGSVGGGVQTRIHGVGKHYLLSRKFLGAEEDSRASSG